MKNPSKRTPRSVRSLLDRWVILGAALVIGPHYESLNKSFKKELSAVMKLSRPIQKKRGKL